ncbi:MAG: PD-(D/E)XK nuclease family transposase [Bacteroidota bacterium]
MAPGDYYTDLKKIIFLGITDFNLFPEYENYRSTHAIVSNQTNVNHLNKIHFTFIELSKFRKYVQDHNLQVENMLWLEEWCHFLNCPPAMDIAFLEGKANSEAVRSACICVGRSQLNERDISLYEATEKRQLDWASSIHAAEQESKAEGRKEGEQVGLKKGKEQGRKEGEQVGLKKGRKEGEQAGLEKGRHEGEQVGLEKAQIKIATQMILAHLPSEQVCTLTGLSTTKVAQLAEKLGQ